MRKLLILMVALVGVAVAQTTVIYGNRDIRGFFDATSGTFRPPQCVGSPGNTIGPYGSMCEVRATAALWICANASGCTLAADWTAAGSVTSVTIAGTANQITVTGTCTGASAITCTLSIPSAFQLPGTINKITLTQPATGSTITVLDGKALTVNNSVTLTATDGSSVAFGTGGTVLYTTSSAGSFPTLNQNTTGTAANLSGTPALPNGTTATTQTQADGTTKIATTAYVDTLGATKLGLHANADTATSATTATTATSATTATNLGGGSTGQFPYQTGAGATGFRTPNAANGPVVLDANGNATIGSTVFASVPGSQSILSGTIANTSIDSAIAVNLASTGTAASHFNAFWVTYAPDMSSHSFDNSAILGYYTVSAGNSQSYSVRQTGVYGLMRHQGTGTMGDARGVYGTAFIAGAGNITVAAGVRGIVSNGASGVMTYGSALFAGGCLNTGSASITNCYGAYLEAQTAGANNWQLYSEGTALSYFAGPITAAALTSSGAAVTSQRDGIGTSASDGLVLANATAATSGGSQVSPRIRLTAQGWKTTATAASQTVDWSIWNNPTQGTTSPSTKLLFQYQVAAGGYTTLLTLDSTGSILTGVNIASGGDIIPTANITYDLGSSGARWRQLFGKTGDFSVSLTVTGNLLVAQQTPATAATACTANTLTADTGFVYFCTASGAWKRVAIATW